MRNTTNKLTLKNGLLSTGSLFFIFATIASAIPSTGINNLQTTSGVTTTLSGSTLNIAAPNKAVLTWQNFGSGTDSISFSDTINYSLPSAASSVLNIVAGSNRTAIDGTISSNGNVYILNPNGIVLGATSRIDTNSFVLSTSDNTAFASYYFQQNGKLPVQDNLSSVAGSTTIANGSIINVTENITIVSKNVDIGGALVQNNLVVTADGNVALASNGTVYVSNNLTVTNPTGTTVLGTAGNTLNVNGNLTVNSVTGSATNVAGTTLNAKTATLNVADTTIGKLTSSNVAVSGNNVNVAISGVANPSVIVAANGNVSLTSAGSLVAGVTNTSANGATAISATGTLTLANVHINSAGATTFTGASVSDSVNDNFVYGPVLFNATVGDVNITKTGNSFGPVSVATTGNATINEGAALNLNAVNAAKLIARTGDFVMQTGTIVAPNASITGVGNVTLSNVNTIGAIEVSGANVAVANNAALIVNNVSATGTLSLTSTGALTQGLNTTVKAQGATAFTATGVTLPNIGNNFGVLTIDVGAGVVTLTEDTTINLAAVRAATGSFKSAASLITSGTNAVAVDNLSIDAAANVTLLSNVRTTNAMTVKAGNVADLSLLSFATNLNSKYPTVTALTYKAPTP